MQVFFGVMAFIVIGAGFPVVYMWSAGRFVGQKPAPKGAKGVVLSLVTLGIGYSALLAIQQVGFNSLISIATAALLAGSSITGVVALQEGFEDATKRPRE